MAAAVSAVSAKKSKSPMRAGRVDTPHVDDLVPAEAAALASMRARRDALCTDFRAVEWAGAKDSAARPTPEFVREFCDDYCLLRYLRARAWDVDDAAVMLAETVKWRWSARPDRIEFADVAQQAAAGSNYQHGFDKLGHPVFYMRARRDPPGTTKEKLDLILYNMEQGIRSMDTSRGIEKFVYIIDLKAFSVSQAGADPKLAQQWISILQSHYPERLGCVFVVDAGLIFTGFWNIISYFIDSETRGKMEFKSQDRFRKDLPSSPWFSASAIESDYGGLLPPKVSDSDYAAAMSKFSNEIEPVSVEDRKPLVKHVASKSKGKLSYFGLSR